MTTDNATKDKLIVLAHRLQNAAYSHGCDDSHPYMSDRYYKKAYDKSYTAMHILLDAIDAAMSAQEPNK